MLEFNTLLVPVDFSPISSSVFDQALELARGDDAVVILMHVVDPTVVDYVEGLGLETREAIVRAARERAQRELEAMKARAGDRVDVQPMVCEGVPFLEILRKADDFQVDAILMGKSAARDRIEKLLFGTTAEHVIRGTTRAVIVIPVVT